VQVINKKVYVNGRLYINPHETHKESTIIPEEQNPRDNTQSIKVPANSYFVMGDNRDRSYDSRFWGVVSSDKIEGLAFIKFWSWDNDNHRVRWNRIGRWIE
jgi:signal peptidase I